MEDLFIPNDGTTIQGADSDRGATIQGEIFTRGVTGLRFRNLTIDGTGKGLFFTNGTYFEFDNVTVTQTAFGVELLRHTGARIRDSFIGPSTSDDFVDSCPALCPLENSTVRIRNSVVEDDGSDPDVGGAILVLRDSSVALRGGNVITNAGTAPAIAISFDSSLRQDLLLEPTTGVINCDVRCLDNRSWVNGDFAGTGKVKSCKRVK